MHIRVLAFTLSHNDAVEDAEEHSTRIWHRCHVDEPAPIIMSSKSYL